MIVQWATDGTVSEAVYDGKHATVWPVNGGFGYNVQIGSEHHHAARATKLEAIESCEYLLLRDIFILTHTGRKFPILCPRPSDIDIVDIAHSLAGINRYYRHTKVSYNVAHHSVLVSYICPPEFALWGLLHDASEAYLGDVVTPLKNMLPDYKWIERRVMHAICRKFGLRASEPTEVKLADKIVTATEFRDLMNYPEWAVRNNVVPMDARIIPWNDSESEYMMIRRFDDLIERAA